MKLHDMDLAIIRFPKTRWDPERGTRCVHCDEANPEHDHECGVPT